MTLHSPGVPRRLRRLWRVPCSCGWPGRYRRLLWSARRRHRLHVAQCALRIEQGEDVAEQIARGIIARLRADAREEAMKVQRALMIHGEAHVVREPGGHLRVLEHADG